MKLNQFGGEPNASATHLLIKVLDYTINALKTIAPRLYYWKSISQKPLTQVLSEKFCKERCIDWCYKTASSIPNPENNNS